MGFHFLFLVLLVIPYFLRLLSCQFVEATIIAAHYLSQKTIQFIQPIILIILHSPKVFIYQIVLVTNYSELIIPFESLRSFHS